MEPATSDQLLGIIYKNSMLGTWLNHEGTGQALFIRFQSHYILEQISKCNFVLKKKRGQDQASERWQKPRVKINLSNRHHAKSTQHRPTPGNTEKKGGKIFKNVKQHTTYGIQSMLPLTNSRPFPFFPVFIPIHLNRSYEDL